MKDLNKAKSTLLNSDFTCVICKDDDIYTSSFRGVKPLVNWYKEGTDLKGFSAADKVIGKATAFLYVLLGVKAVYANVISKSALQVLEENNIYVEYGKLVDFIINRKGDGICPFEGAVMNTASPKDAYKEILNKMEELNIK